MKTFLRLLKTLGPFLGEVLLSIILGVATIAAGIGLLGTSAYLIASAALHPSIAELQVAIVGVRFFGISRAVFRYGERLVSHSVNLHLVSSLRSWFYEQVEKNPGRIDSYKAGDLLDRTLHNLEILENFYVRALSPYIVFAITTAGVCLFVGQYQAILGWTLAGGLAATGILLPLFTYSLSKKPARLVAASYTLLSSAVVESLDGMEEIAAFGSNVIVLERNTQIGKGLSAQQKKLFGLGALGNALAVLFSNLTVLALVWFAIPFVTEGLFSGIILAVIVQVAMASFEGVNALPTAAQQLTQSLAAGRLLFEVEQPTMHSLQVIPSPPVDIPQSLQVEHVGFAAQDGEFSLKDISFDLQPGKKIALVGPSGAGKSSLVDLILKLKQPQQGHIYLGGNETSELSDEWVRSQFGVMGRGDYLFNASLRENLLMAKPLASDSELLETIEKTGLDEWAGRLPQGLDTWLGNHGAVISGGEAQRLLLARVILQARPFLLLDEPLASLDVAIKKDVLHILSDAMPSCGLLWITHEYLFMEKMDEILFIDKGEIIERGDHTLLITKNGKYAEAYQLQAQLD